MDYEESDYEDSYDDDGEYTDDYLGEDDDETDTIPCPACGAEIYEESDSCPLCGEFLHHGYGAGRGADWWTFGGVASQWSPFWFFLALAGVISTIFVLMTLK